MLEKYGWTVTEASIEALLWEDRARKRYDSIMNAYRAELPLKGAGITRHWIGRGARFSPSSRRGWRTTANVFSSSAAISAVT
jgi:hypothetical protein